MGFELELRLTRYAGYHGRCTSEATFALLREALVGVSFGAAIETMVVELLPAWRGTPPEPFGAEDVERYHRYLATLPKVTFRKKKARLEMLWPTDLDSRTLLGQPEDPTVGSFDALTVEVRRALAHLRPRLARTKDFDLEALLSTIEKAVASVPREPVAFHAAVTKALADARTRSETALRARDPWDALNIDWETYHPDARLLLDEPFFWNCADDLAPVGNDTGADVLEGYRAWRRRKKTATTTALSYLHRLLAEWGVPLTGGAAQLQLIRDEACVGLAFSQVMLDGRVDADVAECALQAIARQELTVDKWPDPTRRSAALQRMRDALRRVVARPA